jgi:arylsulfatase A-like enzyme
MRVPTKLLVPSLIVAAVAVGVVSLRNRDHGSRRNLILISIDTLRADHLGSYGYPRPTTPAIDRFARDCVQFERAVAHAPSTLPSHASMLTSLIPYHHGASIPRGWKVDPDRLTLAEHLREHGFRTASFNGGIQLHPTFGLDRGFEIYESLHSERDPTETLAGPENRFEQEVRRALAWLRRTDDPFFLFLHTYEIHHPYDPDPRMLRRFEREYAGPLPDAISLDLIQGINAGTVSTSPADVQHIVDAYDAELRSADRAFAALIAYLKESGRYDRTTILVTSDHGEEFGERESIGWHSHTLYDELLLVPLLVKLPPSEHAGRIVTAQVRGIDLAPTACAALGLDSPPEFAGEDLLPILAAGPDGPWPELPALSRQDAHLGTETASLRVGGWKWYDGRLYDLANDTAERRDVAADRPDVLERMERLLREQLRARPPARIVLTVPDERMMEKLRALGYVD